MNPIDPGSPRYDLTGLPDTELDRFLTEPDEAADQFLAALAESADKGTIHQPGKETPDGLPI